MFAECLSRLPETLSEPGRLPSESSLAALPGVLLRELVSARAARAAETPLTKILASDWLAFSRTGDRAKYEGLYFPRRRRLTDLVCGLLLEDNPAWLDEAVDTVWALCEESAWQLPAHNSYVRDTPQLPWPDVSRPVVDLFAAETGALLAVTARTLGDRLPREVHDRILLEVNRRILTPYRAEHFWWMGNGDEPMCNWTTWCTQNVLLCAFCLPFGEETRRAYAEWFSAAGTDAPAAAAQLREQRTGGLTFQEPLYATGTCEIPLGDRARRGETFFSGEIMHGLGPGNVFVQVGFEYLAEDSRLFSTARNTIYGDVSLFEAEKLPVPTAQTAVKVMNDRGSFVVAARLEKETSYVMLLMRWVAVKMPSEDDRALLQKIADKSISAVQPTILLGTHESCYFNVRFRNMEPCGLTYELTDRDSGEITPDGVYTAPAREGVYEIRISCADAPLICTYAYAIVKKKERGEGE